MSHCPCEIGCPACIGPVALSGPTAKAVVVQMLDALLDGFDR